MTKVETIRRRAEKSARARTERARVEAVSRRASATIASYLLSLPQNDRLLAARAMVRTVARQLTIVEGGVSAASFFSALEGEAYRQCPSMPEKVSADTQIARVFGPSKTNKDAA